MVPLVLVVEDDQDGREVMCQTLEMEGFKALGMENGLDALRYLRDANNELPCLILLDHIMPVMDGAQFYQRFIQDSRLKGVPVVVLSADSRAQEVFAKIAHLDTLPKPFNYEELVETAKRHCKRAL